MKFIFHVVLSVCHKIIHLVVIAVSASKRPRTSPKMTPAGRAFSWLQKQSPMTAEGRGLVIGPKVMVDEVKGMSSSWNTL